MSKISAADIQQTVTDVVKQTPIYDIHTHIYDIPFGELLLWGIDELITYHYLVAEVFRQNPIPFEQFWSMSKTEQADLIWEHLFINNSPVSESCRGVLTCLERLGIDSAEKDLGKIRKYFSEQNVTDYVDTVFETANVESVVMTNNPFDNEERPVWEQEFKRDKRFKAALRMDPLLMEWEKTCSVLKDWGYSVASDLGGSSCSEIIRFLEYWKNRMSPLYMAVSLPPDFTFPEDSDRAKIIENCILPFSRDNNIPFAMMIGVKKLVNPALRLAGDSVGKAKIETVEYLCANYPDNKFLVTFLSRENQHEACIAARKYNNLMLFGCWWFLNNPSIIEEITRERIETLGTSFIPQHSDARVLDQLIYKWTHSRLIIADVLTDKYTDLIKTEWPLTRQDIERDVKNLFSLNFTEFLAR
jgi:hypothetical protein